MAHRCAVQLFMAAPLFSHVAKLLNLCWLPAFGLYVKVKVQGGGAVLPVVSKEI